MSNKRYQCAYNINVTHFSICGCDPSTPRVSVLNDEPRELTGFDVYRAAINRNGTGRDYMRWKNVMER